MAAKTSIIKVSILGDADSVKRAFGQAGDAAVQAEGRFQTSMGRLGSIFAGVGMAAGNALANLPGQAISFLGGAIGKASDLGETLSKNRTIFGESAQGLVDWSEDAAKTLGMTQSAALDATGGLGNMFTQLGIGAGDARALSKANVQLAADFASFHNADPTSVLESVSAAYRGEYDALQKYVPLINAAAVEQEALAMTGKSTTDELTAQDKALAVNALMQKGAGEAAGDFARTQDSASNKAKTASAMWDELQTTLGQKLLPAFSAVTGFLIDKGIPALERLVPVVGGVLSTLGQLGTFLVENKAYVAAAAIGIGVALVPAFVAWGISAGAAAIATIAATLPLIAIVGAFALAAAGVVWLYKNFDIFRVAVDAVGGAVKAVFGWVVDNWQLVLGILTGPIGLAVAIISGHWGAIKSGASSALSWITDGFNGLVGFVTGLPGRISGAIAGLWDGIRSSFRSALNFVIRGWNNLQFGIPGFSVGPIKYGGFTLGVPDIPYLAAGGIATGPTLAMIGEGGRDEAIVPLPRGWRNGDGFGGGTVNNIAIYPPVGSSARDIGRELRRYLREYDRAAGAR